MYNKLVLFVLNSEFSNLLDNFNQISQHGSQSGGVRNNKTFYSKEV